MAKLIFVNRVCWPSEEATAQLLFDLTIRLVERGWDCHIVTDTPGPAVLDAKGGHGVSFHRLASGSGTRATGLLGKALAYRRFARAAYKRLDALVAEGDIVVVMTDPPLLGAKLLPLVTKRRGQLWHWAQDIYPEVAMAIIRNPVISWLLACRVPSRNRAWAQAEQIVTIGRDMADLIRGQIRESPPVTIIPNWYPTSPAPPVPHPFREQLGLSEEHLLVLYSGNLGRAHSLRPILDLAFQLRDRSEIRFVFVGEGAQKSELEEEALRRGLGNVAFESAVPREALDSLLASADIHLVTMRPECQGTVLPSKFHGIVAAQRPSIFIGPCSSDLAHIITSHSLGIACEPDELKPATDYLRRLAASPAARTDTVAPVRAFSATQPSADDTADAWDKLLHEHVTPHR